MLTTEKIKDNAKNKFKELIIVNKTLCQDSFMEGYVSCYKKLDNKFSIDTSKMGHGEKVVHYETNTNETLKDFNRIFQIDSIILDLPDDTTVIIGAIINEGDCAMREVTIGGISTRHNFSKLKGNPSHHMTKKVYYEVRCSSTNNLINSFEYSKDCAEFLEASLPTLRKYAQKGLVFRRKYIIIKKTIDKEFIEYAAPNSNNTKSMVHYDTDGTVLNEFDNVNSAANFFKYTIGTLRVHIMKNKTFKNGTYVRYA